MAISLDRRPVLRVVLIATLVALSLALIVFALGVVKLDREIRSRFAGVRWTLPAQVYAAPQDLYPGVNLSMNSLLRELRRLGYRELPTAEGPGTFARDEGSITLHTRAFKFYEGAQPSQRLTVRGGGRITSVVDADTGTPVELTRLDPLLIGSIYPARGGEDRVLIKLDNTPELLVQGLLAVEDRSFYSHFGVSIRGIVRAFVANLTKGKLTQGASTITQQLVKNFFLTSERTYTRKIKEILMSFLLEVHYSKDEILEAYLNEIFMGQDGARAVHGFGLASQFYFNKPLMELAPEELAMLVAIVKGPSQYDPRRRPEQVRERRDLVLSIWAERGLIKPAQMKSAKAKPLGLSGGGKGGVERYPAFVELVKRQLKAQYPEDAITDEGLLIYTSLSPRVQEALETRISEDLALLERARKIKRGTLEGAGVVTSVEGGEVLGLVAGREVRFAGFNRALDSERSIGSLSKPFVYLAALQKPERYNLGSSLDDEPITVRLGQGRTWRPQNYDRQNHGFVPLYRSLAQSYNVTTVRLGLDVGVGAVQKVFADAGFADAPSNPSMFLGAIDMSPLEVAQVYNTLAAGGYRSPLAAIREVLDKDGTPLKRYPVKVRQTLPEGPVWLTNWAMQKVLTEGTARAGLSILPSGTRLAGKTGTTDDLRDSWFAGFGSDYVGVVWVGRDDYKPSGLTGGSGALPIWARLMRDLDAKSLDDTPPTEVELAAIDCSGQVLPQMAGFGARVEDCVPEDDLFASDPESAAAAEAAAVEAILNGEAAPMPNRQQDPKKTDEPSNWLKELFQ